MYQWFACFSWCILTKHRYYLPNTHTTTSKDIVFRADFSCIFFQFFLLIPPKCDTCDSKKTTLRLECAHLCASTRAREKRSPKILPPLFSSFSLLSPSSLPLSSFSLTSPFFSSGEFSTCGFVFCYVCITDWKLSKEKNAHFLDFFTLWGNIDPYTNRGMRCPSPYLFRNKWPALNTKFLWLSWQIDQKKLPLR